MWRHHGMHGAAHCVLDPAALAPTPCTGRWALWTRALPGCEWGVVRGRQPSGPGDCQSLAASFQVLSLPVSSCPSPLPPTQSLSLSTVFPHVHQSLPLGLFGAQSVSPSDPAVCFRVSLYLTAFVTRSLSFTLSFSFLVSGSVALLPLPHPRTQSICVSGGWGLSTLDHRNSRGTPLWQPQAGPIQARGLRPDPGAVGPHS